MTLPPHADPGTGQVPAGPGARTPERGDPIAAAMAWLGASAIAAPSRDIAEEWPRALHEMTEALTALGLFLATAMHIHDGANPGGIDVGKLVGAALTAHDRAVTSLLALRRCANGR